MTSPEFPAGRIIAGSWPEGSGEAEAGIIIAALADWGVVRGPDWFIATEKGAFSAADYNIVVTTPNIRIMDREAALLRDVSSLADELRVRGAGALDSLAAPFRLIYVDRSTGSLVAAADPSGLGQLFMASWGALSLCASSATLLADLIGAKPCLPALAAYAQLGAFPFELTPFEGITKLLAGNRLIIAHGQPQIQDIESRRAAGDIRTEFVAAVSTMLAAAPDANLELSGGLDSRLILAAIPKDRRAGRRAVTLDSSDGASAEVEVARRIAAMNGLEHKVVPLSLASITNADGLLELLRHVAEGYDYMANPFDKVALVLAGRSMTQEHPRFGGQNGEIIRGFYYPLQATETKISAAQVNRLVDWRLMANDRVTPLIFSDTGNRALTDAGKAFKCRLGAFEGRWGEVLDRIYLRYRMQSWAGTAVNNRFIGHTILWPFFDEGFLAAAFALPSVAKRGSLAAYKMLAELDPELAATPLDNGIIPLQMLKGGSITVITNGVRKAMKATRKVAQRLRPSSTAVMGSDALLDKWHDLECYRKLDVAGLATLGLFSEDVLSQIASGARRADRATLGLLILCDQLVRNARCALCTSP